ncbi:MAG: NrfD/PsrC family molybdoenzyme membrane anchor subunit [Syntrophobacteraceae bacterium]
MKTEMVREIELASRSVNWRGLKLVSTALAAIGAAGFLYGLFALDPRRAWQAYLSNFVFWTGVSMGAFLLSPILVITNAHWGRPVKRLAEAAGAFIPVSFLLFWGIYPGRETIFSWINHPPHEKAKLIWLNASFLFLRDGAGLLVLALLYLVMVRHSVRADLELIRGGEAATGRRLGVQSKAATAFAVLYAFIMSLLAFDLIMSLSPHWVSTLFGAYYFAGSFYTGLAAVILLSAFAVKQMGLGDYITRKHFHDLGKLLFAFCVVCADFFYVQFLVIWYGNLPEETRYVITRAVADPWAFLAWTVLLVCYVIPFLVLLFRGIKMNIGSIAAMSVWILAGMWLERFLLVAPSIWKGPSMPLGPLEILVGVGYLGIFSFCAVWFLERYPVMPVSDPLFWACIGKQAAHEAAAAETLT